MGKITHNIHDRTFQALMHEHAFVLGLLQAHLPRDIVEQVNWATLKLERVDGRHIVGDLKHETQADVLCSAAFGDTRAFFYLHVEHQSKPDKWMALRILNYQTGFLLDYVKRQKKKLDKLPLLISLLYYHGKETPYPYSLDWRDCFEQPAMAAAYTAKPILVDVSQYDDEKIQNESPLIAGTELIFKYIRAKDFSPHLPLVFNALRKAPRNIRQIALQYLINAGQIPKEDLLSAAQHYLSDEDEEYIMATPAQQWRAEGRAEGILIGEKRGEKRGEERGKERGRLESKRQVATCMFAKGYDLKTVADITGLSLDLLRQWQEAELPIV